MMKNATFYLLSLLLVCAVSRANLVMKITADETNLSLGQTTMLRVYGWAEEGTAGNGLYDWSVSAIVGTAGIVQVNSVVVLEPVPVDAGSVLISKNTGGAGNVDAAAALEFSASGSNAGVGGYSELFNFQIEAIGTGSVQYSLSTIVGDLFNGLMYDADHSNVTFDQAGSVGPISVLPEPASLLMLSGLSVLGMLGRKK